MKFRVTKTTGSLRSDNRIKDFPFGVKDYNF